MFWSCHKIFSLLGTSAADPNVRYSKLPLTRNCLLPTPCKHFILELASTYLDIFYSFWYLTTHIFIYFYLLYAILSSSFNFTKNFDIYYYIANHYYVNISLSIISVTLFSNFNFNFLLYLPKSFRIIN